MSTIYNVDQFLDTSINAINKKLAPLNAFSTVFSANRMQKGATVSVPLINAPPTASTFNNSYETAGYQVATQRKVTLTQYFYAWDVTQAQQYGGAAGLDDFADNCASALANTLFRTAMAVFTTASFSVADASGSITNASMTKLQDIVQTAATNGVVGDGKSIIVDEDWMVAAMPVSFYVPTIESEKGTFSRVFGCDVFTSNNIPANGGNKLEGVIAKPSALAIASALPPDLSDANYLDYRVVTVEPLGLPIQYREWASLATGKRWGCFDVLFGVQLGDTGAANLICSYGG